MVGTVQSDERIKASRERQAKLDADIARLREENKRLDEETKKIINDLADKAEQKIKTNKIISKLYKYESTSPHRLG
jgi:septal ring factor EnvC (AmiA/AmiB activator)